MMNIQTSISLHRFLDCLNLTPNYRAGEHRYTEGGLKGCLKHHGLRCLCREHCAVMCNVGRFLWDVDSLWEMHVGGTGLQRPGLSLLVFFLSFSPSLIELCVDLGNFLSFVLFCSVFKVGERKSF